MFLTAHNNPQEFPTYNHSNLNTMGVIQWDEHSSSLLIHERHPVAKLLAEKGAELGAVPVNVETMHQFRSITRDAFARSIDFIRKNVLSRAVRVHNMQTLAVRFTRADNKVRP